MNKPILCLDFDGVCHSYVSGWRGGDVIPDPAVDGLFEFLEAAKEHFDIQIFSARSHQAGGIDAMLWWFLKERKLWRERGGKPPLDTPLDLSFPEVKPPAMVTIDDRSLLFTGKWPSIEELKNFKPWYQQPKGFDGGPAAEYFIEFSTQIQPGKIVATRIRIDQITVADMNQEFRLDLSDHPLYSDLKRYVRGNE